MSEYTTVRLTKHTRDDVNALASELGVSVEQAISEAVATTRWEALRRQAEHEARLMSRDPADRAEVDAAIRDLNGEPE